jgi:hypothetical protein
MVLLLLLKKLLPHQPPKLNCRNKPFPAVKRGQIQTDSKKQQQTQFLTDAAAAAFKFSGAPEGGDTDQITWLT